MSVKIFNGYLVFADEFLPFLDETYRVMDKVRDHLDAVLLADLLSDLFDRHERGQYRFIESLKMDAIYEFEEHVSSGRSGTVFHHPHSLDIDIRVNPTTWAHPETGEQATAHFVVVHAQRRDYFTAFEALPGVVPFPYWNGGDPPEGTTDQEWAERREAWNWLIEAHSIGDVTYRWTFRDNPSPKAPQVLADETILAALPSRYDRALRIANNIVAQEATQGIPPGSYEAIQAVVSAVGSRKAVALAHTLEPSITDITPADMHLMD